MRLHRTASPWLRPLLWLAACTAGLTAQAQIQAPAGKTPECLQDAPMGDGQLRGEWAGSIEGQSQTVHLRLGPHPQWEGTVKGTIERSGASGGTRPMVGDVDDGNVTLEESADGTQITATWLGTVVEGSCAREIRGDYLEGKNAPPQPFVLRRLQP